MSWYLFNKLFDSSKLLSILVPYIFGTGAAQRRGIIRENKEKEEIYRGRSKCDCEKACLSCGIHASAGRRTSRLKTRGTKFYYVCSVCCHSRKLKICPHCTNAFSFGLVFGDAVNAQRLGVDTTVFIPLSRRRYVRIFITVWIHFRERFHSDAVLPKCSVLGTSQNLSWRGGGGVEEK